MTEARSVDTRQPFFETYVVNARWGARLEPIAARAERLAGLLDGLARCEPALGRWYEQGETEEAARLHPVRPDPTTLYSLVTEDDAYDVEHGLGRVLGLWNGGVDGESASIILTCGSTNPYASNGCVLKLGLYDPPIAERVLRVPLLTAILRCVVAQWSPDWGYVVANSRILDGSPAGTPRMGWLVYLSTRRGPIPALPAPFQVRPLPQGGAIIVTAADRHTYDRDDHPATTAVLRTILDAAGILGAGF